MNVCARTCTEVCKYFIGEQIGSAKDTINMAQTLVPRGLALLSSQRVYPPLPTIGLDSREQWLMAYIAG